MIIVILKFDAKLQQSNEINNLKKGIDKFLGGGIYVIISTLQFLIDKLCTRRCYSVISNFCKKLFNCADVIPIFFVMRVLRTIRAPLVIHMLLARSSMDICG